MSHELTPVLSGAIPAYELFMTRWEDLCKDYPETRDWVNAGMLWAEKYYNCMDCTNAYVIAMCELVSSPSACSQF